MTDTPISRAAVLAILRTPKSYDTFPDMIARVEALEGCGDVFMPSEHNREFVLLGSYCGDDNPDCCKKRPCAECLSMCNVFGHDGQYRRMLGGSEARILAALEPMEPKDE
jgi:hypothetical protein